jgi:hypothetical protein
MQTFGIGYHWTDNDTLPFSVINTVVTVLALMRVIYCGKTLEKGSVRANNEKIVMIHILMIVLNQPRISRLSVQRAGNPP